MKPGPRRERTAQLLIKLRPVERIAIEQAAEREQTTMSSVARKAILRELRRAGREDE